jgi:hypothetical protein
LHCTLATLAFAGQQDDRQISIRQSH